MRKLMMMTMMFCLVLSFCSSGIASATHNTADAEKPRVVVIRADWCPYCQKIEPVLKDLQSEYKDWLEFVALDVTDAKTTTEASQTATRLGLGKFFAENKEKTSTVAIFKGPELVFQISGVQDRAAYVREFERALHK